MITKAGFGICVTLLLCLCSCSKTTTAPTEEKELRRGLGGEPSTLDPMAASDTFSFEVLRDLYEGLTTQSPTGEVLPGVASSWTVDPSGIRYTFQLRTTARWSNGQPVRARDFVNAWRRVVDPKQASPLADDLRLIVGATSIIAGTSPPETLGVYAPDDMTLIVNLEQPAPYLPQLLTHSAAYPIYSATSASSRNPKTWVSNGAYVLNRWSPGTTVDLVENPNYWDHTKVKIQRVQYQIADETSQFARYRAGQLDMTDTVPANAIPKLRSEQPRELFVAPFLATAYYGLNLSSKPFANNVPLRQAIAMAIDRDRLVASLAFGQTGAYGFVPPGTWNYSPQSWAWKDLPGAKRVAEAKHLYAQAGYSEKAPLHLRLLLNSNPVIRNTAIIIAEMWKEVLGIDTELIEEEYKVFLESRHNKSRWDVARLGWTADYNDASNFLDIFRGRSSNNDSGYSNTNFDGLLNQAATLPDQATRRAVLEASEKMMLEDYPVIPLYFFVSKRLVKPYLHGVESNPLNQIRSSDLSLSPHQ